MPKTRDKAKLTLTNLYNVLEALREGRPLSAKEKAIHTHGLVGVLKELHDELDAAVLHAYGWNDLRSDPAHTPELLNRLVTLNAQRAAEEQTGQVRWLRPEYQNPPSSATPASQQTQLELQDTADASTTIPKTRTKKAGKDAATPRDAKAPPWSSSLPEQVRSVAALLAKAETAVHLSAIEASFTSRGAWKKGLPLILETLEAMGRARNEGNGLWRAQQSLHPLH